MPATVGQKNTSGQGAPTSKRAWWRFCAPIHRQGPRSCGTLPLKATLEGDRVAQAAPAHQQHGVRALHATSHVASARTASQAASAVAIASVSRLPAELRHIIESTKPEGRVAPDEVASAPWWSPIAVISACTSDNQQCLTKGARLSQQGGAVRVPPRRALAFDGDLELRAHCLQVQQIYRVGRAASDITTEDQHVALRETCSGYTRWNEGCTVIRSGRHLTYLCPLCTNRTCRREANLQNSKG
mmetsp:Transcript_101155/g.182577  ORF Transcript_101155/g.182577 Transcript_101155/m.182577 type:complete len:243 (-) Transcript_101155:683-1411(-)